MSEVISTQVTVDPEWGSVVNATGISDVQVFNALHSQQPEMAALVRWTTMTRPPVRFGSLFDRDRYLSPINVFDEMRVAQEAALNDDVVAGVIESTESLAFAKMSLECDDPDEEDVWNQIAGDLDLDSRLREMWRETFTVSQAYVGVYWGTKSYKVRGKTDKGVKRKKTFDNLTVPLGLTILDPLKVVPVGNFYFNQERLAYIANRGDVDAIEAVINGERTADPLIGQLILGKYQPDEVDIRQLADTGVAYDFLYELNPNNVFRHTDTRSQYNRFAPIRMKSVFELLDLKQQLRQMDRAHLVGGTNFIVLITKGSDQIPAKPQEILNLQNQVRTVARVPVLVGDHRLKVEIVTPKLDETLKPERYNGLDSRIEARLFGMFMTGNFAAGAKADDSIKLARVVGRGLESRRHMMRRSLERNVLQQIFARNAEFTDPPNLVFHPKHVSLDFDPAWANYLLDLRDRGDVSRHTVLEEIDVDQEQEAKWRQLEADRYDDKFTLTNVPFSAPGAGHNIGVAPGGKPKADNADGTAPVAPHGHDVTGNPVALPPDPAAPKPGASGKSSSATTKSAGRRLGGNRGGGGAAPGTGQGQAPRNPAKKSD